MDSARAELLRDLLAADPLVADTRIFGASLRRSATIEGGLMLVGTPQEDPWHLTAHLDDEARYSGVAELAPTLVRWAPPPGAPPHLAIGLERLEHARRGETVFVVAPDAAPDALLERVDDAKRIGATVLAMSTGDQQLTSLAHEALIVPSNELWTPATRDDLRTLSAPIDADDSDVSTSSGLDLFDTTQHLVSLAVGESIAGASSARSLRARWTRFIDGVTGAPSKW
jgi:hypothetical protein